MISIVRLHHPDTVYQRVSVNVPLSGFKDTGLNILARLHPFIADQHNLEEVHTFGLDLGVEYRRIRSSFALQVATHSPLDIAYLLGHRLQK